MSAQAVAASTRALRGFLLAALSTGRSVTLLPPGEDPPVTGSGVNLYLYQVVESPHLKNTAYPGDRAGAPPRDAPVLSLELSYLLTPFGPTPGSDDETDEAHAALGEAMLALHDDPILNRVHGPGFDADGNLAAALRDSFEDLRVRLQPLSVEDLSRIWSTIGKPYRLSVAYQLTVVQLRGPDRAVTVPEVVRTAVSVGQLGPPRPAALLPARGAVAALSGGAVVPARLQVTGAGLAGPGRTPTVTVAGVRVRVASPVSAEAITVDLPQALPAGPQADVAVSLGGPVAPGLTFRVDPFASTLTPVRSVLAEATTVVVTGSGLATAVEIVATVRSGTAPLWTAPVDPARTDDTGTRAELPAGSPSNAGGGGVRNGQYDLRVRLASGALSNLRVLLVAPVLEPFGAAAAGSQYDPAQRRLVLRGVRLDGADVRLRVDGEQYPLGRQSDAATVSHELARPLGPGEHLVELDVDGYRSDAVVLAVAP